MKKCLRNIEADGNVTHIKHSAFVMTPVEHRKVVTQFIHDGDGDVLNLNLPNDQDWTIARNKRSAKKSKTHDRLAYNTHGKSKQSTLKSPQMEMNRRRRKFG